MENQSSDRAILTASNRSQRGCVAATAVIWGCSTGMLAIDLLLSADAASGAMIAVAIVAAAAVSTMTVWLAARKPDSIQQESEPE
ncbi:MAG: hypothetical protein HC895_01265 [Leptolyngbyaceae cyanobacterium SM1_3_5]|nr:hypothetical protein [Leptolyngbyaceae cyanobacterium SM1_3_5]